MTVLCLPSYPSWLLEQSSANLRSTTAAHDTLSSLLSTSKHLITALEKSDWLDRLLILAAVTFFFLVVLFILKQRVIDKGLRVAFWWTRFIPDFGGDIELQKVNSIETGTTVTMTALSTSSSLLASTATRLLASPEPEAGWEFSHSVPSGLASPTPEVQGVDDTVQEILQSTLMPYSIPITYETSTIRQSDHSLHEEL